MPSEWSRLRLMADFGDALIESGARIEDIHRLTHGGSEAQEILKGLIGVFRGTHRITKVEVPSLVYPKWAHRHLTPGFEVKALCDPGETELWIDPRQTDANMPTGYEVYSAMASKCLLGKSLSFGEIKFFEATPDRIPLDWSGNLVYAWASVALRDSADAEWCVPFLNCRVDNPHVDWRLLGNFWTGHEPAGLRRTV